ncbi:MAG TPA: flagellar basal body-associated FliL family protein [Gallionellaceae bacterium]|nr:flagellar basal body-associated FliL family protein [Gallionellaceae bacterium]
MAQNAKPAPQKPEALPVQKNDKKTTILMGIIAIMALVIAAGGGWYAANMGKDSHHVEEVKVAPPKTPLFVVLDPFTVNLHREPGENDQYLQLGITLKAFESDVEAKIKTNLPEIRSKILQLLTTKTATELLTATGKKQLVTEIVYMSNAVIGIVNAPATTDKTPKVAAAPQTGEPKIAVPPPGSELGTEAQLLVASAPVAKPEPPKAVEHKGIADVLFTSFIIQ